MVDNWTARAILGIACALLAAHAAPSPRDFDSPTESVDPIKEADPVLEVDPLMDDDFYEEFPEIVNPSAKSSKCLTFLARKSVMNKLLCHLEYLIHTEDMVFIKSGKNKTRTKRNAVFYREDLWPGARIPYEIAPTFDSKLLEMFSHKPKFSQLIMLS